MESTRPLKNASRPRGKFNTLPSEYNSNPSQITSLQTLLVGVENLNSAVTCDNPVPLSEIVSDLKRVSGESAFLHPVLDSLPAAAIESGVVSSKALRNSFTGVKQLGKNTQKHYFKLLSAYDNHLCNESQHGFVMSSLSRLYSFFGVRLFTTHKLNLV